MTNTVRKLLAAGAALLVVGSITVATPAAPVAAQEPPPDDHGWIDTTDREAVLQSFVDEYLPDPPGPGFTGDVDSCDPGTTSDEYRAAMLSRVNWYRAMAGAGDPLTEDLDLTSDAQALALWGSATARERGGPSTHDPCGSIAAIEGYDSGMVALGFADPLAIDYLTGLGRDDDSEAYNRSRLLDERMSRVGFGTVDVPWTDYLPIPASALVTDDVHTRPEAGPLRDPDRIVTWPSPGYFPSDLVPETWSVDLRSVDIEWIGVFTARVQVWVDGVEVPVSIHFPRNDLLTFEPQLPLISTTDAEVRVEVTNIGSLTAPSFDYAWTTTVMGIRPRDGSYERARSVYRPITPCRVSDTRLGYGERIVPGDVAFAQVTGTGPFFERQGGRPGGCGIPDDATAVEATLTAVAPTSDGYARIGAAIAPTPEANALMFTGGRNRASTTTIPLSPSALYNVVLENPRGSTHYVLDVHGYYVPEDQPGLRYTPVTPCRVADTRKGGGALGTTTNRAFQVQGSGAAFTAQGGSSSGCGIPADAAAVKTTVTAVPTTTRTGYLRTWASQTTIPSGSFLQHNGSGTTVTNTGNVAVGTNGKIALGNRGGPSHYMVDVVGYYSETGAYAYTPIQACRAVDTRRGIGEFAARRRAFEVVGVSGSAEDRAAFVAQGGSADTCDVPATATAVDTTVTALDPVGNGYSILWPSMTRQPTVRALNYRSGQWTSNTVAVPTGDQQRIALANVAGRTDYLLELTGYYEP